ncbi:pectate lyase-like [Prosopis cineraria]|uniref:pectate lyase-like n=1 Tax=Prosopis cineraria TaxID=364024 RepID=UPI0024102254|nr:pectate lyase-like [Prosopis cineraria]
MGKINRNSPLFSFFFLIYWVAIPTLHANVLENETYWKGHASEFDQYWHERANEAEKVNKEEFQPNPYDVVGNLTASVDRMLLSTGDEGRNLRQRIGLHEGPCLATNPIDRCWRCDPNWANNRQKLADCALGFGKGTTGGKGGRYYVVTDPSDNDMLNPKEGTLRHAVTRNGPLWIIFQRSMVIKLQQELIMSGDKTIDGRGANVIITGGAGITIQFVKNVIIHNIKIFNIVSTSGGLIRDSEDHFGLRTRSDGDGISIFGSSKIWIDHVSMSNCQDGLIDAIMGSTAITISNGHFTKHNEVMLFGASDSYAGDQIMQITVAFNHFGQGLIQRMPRCRWGFVHVVNNDYTHWEMYAIGGSQHPTIISEGNRFIAPNNMFAKEVCKREYSPQEVWKNWQWRSINDLLMNGATFAESGTQLPVGTRDMLKGKPGSYVSRLTRFSGMLKCRVGRPC